MTEARVKCEKCGFDAVKKIGPMSNISFDFGGKDFFTICRVIAKSGRIGGTVVVTLPAFS
jgi:hypothetical protein